MKEDTEVCNAQSNVEEEPALANLIDAVLIATILNGPRQFAAGEI